MKKFLARLFFFDKPGPGAFFGMTMLMTLPWLYLSLICVLLGNEGLTKWILHGRLGVLIPIIIVGIPLYTLLVYAKSLGQTISPLTSRAKRLCRWACIYVLFLLPLVFAIEFLAKLDFFLSSESYAIFTFCILLFLFGSAFLLPSCGAVWKKLAIIFLWPIGFIGLSLIFAYGVLPFFVFYDKLPSGPPPIVQYHDYQWLTAIREFFMISGVGWKWLAITSFVCFFAGYFLQAQALCRFWKISYRQLLSKRAIFVMILCLFIYLVSLPFALFAEEKYKHSRRKLEHHFGKSIVPQTLENKCCCVGKDTGQTWLELKHVLDNMTPYYKENFCLIDSMRIDPLLSKWENELYRKWEIFYLRQKEIECINDFLDGEIPPIPRQYCDVALIELDGLDCPDIRMLANCFDAQLWQLRFAMEHQDINTAHVLFTRMQKICSYLYDKGLPSYLAAQKKYLLALCRFIEYELADRQWIDSQFDFFSKHEADFFSLEERIQFFEAVRFCAILDGISHRLGESVAQGADLSQLRWFFPQAWWPAAEKANAVLRAFEDYLTTGKTPLANSPEMISERAIGRISNQSKRAKVQVFCAKMLFEVEKIKQQTGSYPITMPSLPVDPYTQKPLQYDVGTFEFEIQTVYDGASEEGNEGSLTTEECESGKAWVNPRWKMTKANVNMVRVFSPGVNLAKDYDDICFFIRLE